MSTQQWANIGDDEGALYALLPRILEHVPLALIDYLWIFPPRRIAIGESIVIVVGAFAEDPGRRRVSTAHFTISRNKKGQAFVNTRMDEHGSAPLNAVTRVVDGVLRRLGEETEAPPREELIDGDVQRWDALIVALGGRPPVPESPIEPAPADDVAPARTTPESSESGATGLPTGVG